MEDLLKCSTCKEFKTKDNFYKVPQYKGRGYAYKCKPCMIAFTGKMQKKNKDKIKENHQKRIEKIRSNPETYNIHLEKVRSHYRNRIENDPNFAKQRREYQRRKRQSGEGYPTNKRIVYAHSLVQYAVRQGKLPHPTTLTCAHCSNQAQEYHHHNGYEKEHLLDVEALCVSCHGKTRRIKI